MTTKTILTLALVALAFSAISTGTASAQSFGFNVGFGNCSPGGYGYTAPAYYGGYSSYSPGYSYYGGYRNYSYRRPYIYAGYSRFRSYRRCW